METKLLTTTNNLLSELEACIGEFSLMLQDFQSAVDEFKDIAEKVPETKNCAIFKTCTITDYENLATEILQMYSKELSVKIAVFAALGGRFDSFPPRSDIDLSLFLSDLPRGRVGRVAQDTLTIYLSAWLMEPYLDTQILDNMMDTFSFELKSKSTVLI
eukprot:TRINITY_DN4124_c0_g3_i2.p1 TRINITY_DN4124_c0_g3~~TRINITY_DN4124_c0_g3_i2.p1  ORF type:complete len:159 (+),score=16.95 TRINITY_DN4124_c0_g3_i2:242-718(+)